MGCGTGRWAASFHRDRPDITIDVLDRSLSHTHLPADLSGARYTTTFEAFTPDKLYDGIWSFAALFFLKRDDFFAVLQKLSSALKPSGILAFTMVDDCEHARAFKFFGLSEEHLTAAIASAGLSIVTMRQSLKKYGDNDTEILTFFVTAKYLGT